MRKREWPLPTKRKGRQLERLSLKVEPAFKLALEEYSVEESQRLGRLVSKATILQALALESDARLRRLSKNNQR